MNPLQPEHDKQTPGLFASNLFASGLGTLPSLQGAFKPLANPFSQPIFNMPPSLQAKVQ